MHNEDDLAETAIGTPYYLSPEICEKKPYGYTSDRWSLGCLLYEMLSFRRPLEASSIGALVLSILSGRYKPLPSHWSKEIKKLVSKMLSVDPDDRPSIDEILKMPLIRKRASAILKTIANESPSPFKKLIRDSLEDKNLIIKDLVDRKSTARLSKCKSRLLHKELHGKSARADLIRVIKILYIAFESFKFY